MFASHTSLLAKKTSSINLDFRRGNIIFMIQQLVLDLMNYLKKIDYITLPVKLVGIPYFGMDMEAERKSPMPDILHSKQ